MPKRDFRVIHLVPALFGPQGIVGGAERYVLELAKAMAAAVPTSLVTFGPEDRTTGEGDLQIDVIGRPLHVRGQHANPFSPRLFSRLRPATVIHCHQQHILASSLAALFCRLTGRRVFVSDLGGGGWDVSAYVSTDRWYHGHLHISEYSKRVFGHSNNPRAHVILGGVDTQKFSPSRNVPRKGYALYVGRLLPHKGVNYLIEGLPVDMELIVIGAPYDQRYARDLEQLAQGKRVEFRHNVDDADLITAYREALCIVLPSVYQTVYGDRTKVPELLGQTLVEGMACGTPALCTDVASMPEVVDHEVSGFVVPPNDGEAIGAKLAWLRDHPQEWARMGGAARERVESTFTWNAVVDRCLEIYRA